MLDKLRLCIACAHFNFDGGHGPYSPLTPGDCAEISCAKGIWPHKSLPDLRLSDFRKILLTAEKCRNFKLADDLLDLKGT